MRSKINSPRQLAIKMGHTWYLPNKPCPACGEWCRKRVSNGQPECGLPRKAESPRQTARKYGLKWFDPGVPCPRCGGSCPQRVATSRPLCQELGDATMSVIAANADMSREDAKAYGFKAYKGPDGQWLSVRTGRPVGVG